MTSLDWRAGPTNTFSLLFPCDTSLDLGLFHRLISARVMQLLPVGTPLMYSQANSMRYSVHEACCAVRTTHVVVALDPPRQHSNLDSSLTAIAEQLSTESYVLIDQGSNRESPSSPLPFNFIVFRRHLLDVLIKDSAYDSLLSLATAIIDVACENAMPLVWRIVDDNRTSDTVLHRESIVISSPVTHYFLQNENRLVACTPRDDRAFETIARPTVSLCMIARDNEAIIAECLSSIRPWVDEMIVVDTGSRDETQRIARECGAHVFEFPWCDDFAAARNESLRRARGEWLFWMDTDDTISEANGQKLRQLVDGQHPPDRLGYIMQVACMGTDDEQSTDITIVDHVKLLRNHPQLRFEGRIHEQILPAIRRERGSIEWTDIVIEHTHGSRSNSQRQLKHQRDLRLLELENCDRPDHPFTLFNLGMTYADMERHDDAVNALSRSILVGSALDSQVRKSYALLACSLISLGRFDAAYEVLEKALAIFPDDQELQFRLGVYYQARGNNMAAIDAYRGALNSRSEGVFRSVDCGIGSYKCRHNLAIALQNVGETEKAREEWRQAIVDEPRFAAAWTGLIDLELRQSRAEEVCKLLRRMDAISELTVAAALAQIEIHRRNGEDDIADGLLQETFDRHPNNRTVSEQYTQRMFDLERWPIAEQALLTMSSHEPNNATIYHNLAVAYLNQGQYAAAKLYASQSLSIDPNRTKTHEVLDSASKFCNLSPSRSPHDSLHR